MLNEKQIELIEDFCSENYLYGGFGYDNPNEYLVIVNSQYDKNIAETFAKEHGFKIEVVSDLNHLKCECCHKIMDDEVAIITESEVICPKCV